MRPGSIPPPSPPTELSYPFTELIKRLRILTTTLLPLEVDQQSINDPTSRIITPKVIAAYMEAAGSLVEAVCNPSSETMCLHSKSCLLCLKLPYCLIRARRSFMIAANRDPADYGENRGRGNVSTILSCLPSHNL